MNRIKNLQRWIIFAVIFALLFPPMQVVQAQELKTITATGTLTRPDNESFSIPLTMTFPPAGGEVTGSAYFYYSENNSDGTISEMTVQWTFEGTFAGGDGGAAVGTVSGTIVATGNPVFEYTGPWSGNFYANGTGNGVYDATVSGGGQSASGQFIWQVTFSAEEFAAALQPTVTSEYIFATYGIRVEDSLAGDKYGQKVWSEHELSLLNDVLKEIPPDLLKNMALTSFVRSQYNLDANGNPKPTTFGAYFCCGSSGVADMSGSSAAIRVFDQASSPFDFTNDPGGDTQFKATILHEMIHAMQYRRDQYSVYDNPYKSPLLQTYMDATLPLHAVDTGIWENGWTWYEARGAGGDWKLWSTIDTAGNKPPTDYGKKNPLEDMCESVMIYVYDPQRLKDSSMLRYNFIKDQMFGGIEYENGIQKP